MNTVYQQWLDAKALEKECIEHRIDVEEQIIALLGQKDEGGKTHTIELDNVTYKVDIKGVVNRSIDQAEWNNIKEQIPENMHPVKYKAEPVAKGIKYLQNNEPDTYRIFAKCLTVKPGKTGVTVKKVES